MEVTEPNTTTETMTVSVAPLIVVRDLKRALRFYVDGLTGRLIASHADYALVQIGNSDIHLAVQGPPPPDRPIPLRVPDVTEAVSTLLVLSTSNLERARERLQGCGFPTLGKPTVPPWGGEIRAFVYDPDNHLVELNQALP